MKFRKYSQQFVGMYPMSLAAIGENDAAISLSEGCQENGIEICLYDAENKMYTSVKITLSRKDAKRVIDGFNEASTISRRKIREENAEADTFRTTAFGREFFEGEKNEEEK